MGAIDDYLNASKISNEALNVYNAFVDIEKRKEEERKKLVKEQERLNDELSSLRKDIGLDKQDSFVEAVKNNWTGNAPITYNAETGLYEGGTFTNPVQEAAANIMTLGIPKAVHSTMTENKAIGTDSYDAILKDLTENKAEYVERVGGENYNKLYQEVLSKSSRQGDKLSGYMQDIGYGDLQVKRNTAWDKYYQTNSIVDKQVAQRYDQMLDTYIYSHPDTGKQILSGTANWLPQGLYYAKKNAPATIAAAGAVAAGYAVGAPELGKIAGKYIYGIGSIASGFQGTMEQTRGGEFGDMVRLGIPEDIARNAAQNSAFWQAIIEEAETGKDIFQIFQMPLKKGVANKIKEFFKDWGMNIITEGLEEGSQSIVGYVHEWDAARRAGIDTTDYTAENMFSQAWEEAKGGAEIGATMYLAEGLPHIVIGAVTNNRNQRLAIQDAPLNSTIAVVPTNTDEYGNQTVNKEQFKKVLTQTYDEDIKKAKEIAAQGGENAALASRLVKQLEAGKERNLKEKTFNTIVDGVNQSLDAQATNKAQTLTRQTQTFANDILKSEQEKARNSGFKNMEFNVADKITTGQKNLASFAKNNLGLNVVYYTTKNGKEGSRVYRHRGMWIEGDTIFVNQRLRTTKNALSVIGHEYAHDNFYKNEDVRNKVYATYSNEEAIAYGRDHGWDKPGFMSQEEINKYKEEMYADDVGEYISQQEVINQIESGNKSAAKVIKDTLANIIENTTGYRPQFDNVSQYNMSGTSVLNGVELSNELKEAVDKDIENRQNKNKLSKKETSNEETKKETSKTETAAKLTPDQKQNERWYEEQKKDNKSRDQIQKSLALRMKKAVNSTEVKAEMTRLEKKYNQTKRSAEITDDTTKALNPRAYNNLGDRLTLGQQRFYKASVIRDKSGRLIVVYHTTTDLLGEPFYVFAPEDYNGNYRYNGMTVVFVTSSKFMSSTYARNAGRIATVKANKAVTLKSANEMLRDASGYIEEKFEVKKEKINGKYKYVVKENYGNNADGAIVKEFRNLQDFKDNFADWLNKKYRYIDDAASGEDYNLGERYMQFPLYANVVRPFIIDGYDYHDRTFPARNWNDLIYQSEGKTSQIGRDMLLTYEISQALKRYDTSKLFETLLNEKFNDKLTVKDATTSMREAMEGFSLSVAEGLAKNVDLLKNAKAFYDINHDEKVDWSYRPDGKADFDEMLAVRQRRNELEDLVASEAEKIFFDSLKDMTSKTYRQYADKFGLSLKSRMLDYKKETLDNIEELFGWLTDVLKKVGKREYTYYSLSVGKYLANTLAETFGKDTLGKTIFEKADFLSKTGDDETAEAFAQNANVGKALRNTKTQEELSEIVVSSAFRYFRDLYSEKTKKVIHLDDQKWVYKDKSRKRRSHLEYTTNDIIKAVSEKNYNKNVANLKSTYNTIKVLGDAASINLATILRNSVDETSKYIASNSFEIFKEAVSKNTETADITSSYFRDVAMKNLENHGAAESIIKELKKNPNILKQFYLFICNDEHVAKAEKYGAISKNISWNRDALDTNMIFKTDASIAKRAEEYGYDVKGAIARANELALNFMKTFLSDYWYNVSQEEILAVNGYDGVWFKNIRDYGTEVPVSKQEPGDVIVGFASNQFNLISNEKPTMNPNIKRSEEIVSDDMLNVERKDKWKGKAKANEQKAKQNKREAKGRGRALKWSWKKEEQQRKEKERWKARTKKREETIAGLKARAKEKQRVRTLNTAKRELLDKIKRFEKSKTFKFMTDEQKKTYQEKFGNIYKGGLSKKAATKQRELIKAQIAQALIDDPNIVVSQRVKNMVTSPNKVTLDAIQSIDEMNELLDAFSKITEQVQKQQQLVGLSRAKDALTEQKEFSDAVRELDNKHEDKKYALKERRAARDNNAIGKLINTLQSGASTVGEGLSRFFETALSTVETELLRAAQGNRNSKLMDLYKNLNEGVTRERAVIVRLRSILNKYLTDKEYQTLRRQLNPRTDWYDTGAEVTDTKGRKHKLILDHGRLISLAMHSMQEQSLKHIGGAIVDILLDEDGDPNVPAEGGGLVIPDMELAKKGQLGRAVAEGYTIKLTPEEINAIVGKKTDANGNVTFTNLTKEENDFVKGIQEFFEQTKEYTGEVYKTLKGIDLPMVENYFPLVANKSFIFRTPGNNLTAKNIAQAYGMFDKMGFVKERNPNAYNPIVLENVADVLSRMMNGVAKYYGYNIALHNNEVLLDTIDGDFSVRDALGRIAPDFIGASKGKGNYDVLTGFISGTMAHPNDIFARWRGRHAEFTLGLNPGSWVKQLLSIPTTAKYFTTKEVLGFASGGVKELYDTMKAYLESIDDFEKGKGLQNFLRNLTPDLDYRSGNFGLPDLSDVIDNKSIFAKMDILKGISRADRLGVTTVTRMFLYAELSRRNLLGDELTKIPAEEADQIFQEIGYELERFLRQTQPDYSQVYRANISRNSGAIARFITMYSTPVLQMMNNMLQSAYELDYAMKNGTAAEKAHAWNVMLKSGMGVFVASLGGVLISRAFALLFQGGKKYDDDYEFGKELVVSMLAPTLVLDDLARGFLGMTTYESQTPELIAFDALTEIGSSLHEIATGKSENSYNKWKKIATNTGLLFGIPARDIYKIGKAVLMYADSDLYYNMALRENTNAFKKWIETEGSPDTKEFYKAYTATRDKVLESKYGYHKADKEKSIKSNKKESFRKALEDVFGNDEKKINEYMTILGDYKS